MNSAKIDECCITSVNDESGSDPTYFQDGFVYVYHPIHGITNMKDLDDKDSKDFEPEALLYAVSLRELVLAAKEAGILDKLAKRTRNDLK